VILLYERCNPDRRVLVLFLAIPPIIATAPSLPILLWSYGMLTIEELDKLYSFLFQKMDK